MGHIFKRGGFYFECHRDEYGRRRRRKVGQNRRLAEEVLAREEAKVIERRRLGLKATDRLKFRDLVALYEERVAKVEKAKTWAVCERYYVPEFVADFGEALVHEITASDVGDFKQRLLGSRTKATVNRMLGTLSSIFRYAIQRNVCSRNPVKETGYYKVCNMRHRYIEPHELQAFLAKASEPIRQITLLAYYTGMRKSEILTLKWDQVHFNESYIFLPMTKNKSQRAIPLSGDARSLLVSIRRSPKSVYVFPSPKKGFEARSFGDIKKGFAFACKRGRIKDFQFHDMRRTFITDALKAGVDVNTIREIVGHKRLDMIVRYAHATLPTKQDAIDKISSRRKISAPTEPPSQHQATDAIHHLCANRLTPKVYENVFVR